MNEQNSLSAGFRDTMYGNEWTKLENNSSLTEQLEKLNKVRESIYSPGGWSSENVNQSSKWLVDVDDPTKNNIHKYNNEMGTNRGTNLWTSSQIAPCSSQTDVKSNDGDMSIALRLQMETLNVGGTKPTPYCQIPKQQPQIDCLPPTFF